MARPVRLAAALLLLAAGLPLAGAAHAAGEAEGSIVGRVFDAETGAVVSGVTVILVLPAPEGAEPRQEIRVSDDEGAFEFASVPAGSYSINFAKSGYRASTMQDVAVQAGQANRADFPLPPLPPETADEILELEAYVVEQSTVNELLESLEVRLESDQLLNVMSAEDLSRFAASDVAEALKRVAGVNVVKGQFAIIRGLEDRYSSTLFNGAPIPSPDPNSQSVQLDLFPSDVVGNLVVTKTFAPDLPSNSSGGSIDIVTTSYPDEPLQIKLSGGSGFNENAIDRFVQFVDGSPIGEEADAWDTVESDFGLSLGGRRKLLGREVRFKAVGAWEIDYETKQGFQESREPIKSDTKIFPLPPRVVRSGGLALGELFLTKGHFDLTESERTEQTTGYLGLGFDLDEAGNHKLDASVFYTKKEQETAQLKENGYLPNFDYGDLIAKDARGDIVDDNDFLNSATLDSWIADSRRRDEPVSLGALWFTNFSEGQSFLRDRDLLVYQLNGDHRFDALDGLHLSWAANQARTTQQEESRATRFFFEPDDLDQPAPTTFPVTADVLGSGRYAANGYILFSENQIEENQDFARLDGDYEAPVFDMLTLTLTSGGWYERSKRSVDATFLESPQLDPASCGDMSQNCTGSGSQFAIFGDTPAALGRTITNSLLTEENGDLRNLRHSQVDALREIWAWNVDLKATFWEKVDLLGGLRLEDILIRSKNDAFNVPRDTVCTPDVSGCRFGAVDTFPTRYLFFDRLDNPALDEGSPPPGTVFNDEILGIRVPVDPVTGLVDLQSPEEIDALINGEIKERRYLPSAGVAFRPLDGLTLRGAYSQTVARPSFREISYYVSLEPGKDDRIVGNPQLQLSDVESFDGRVEYSWGELGDLVAVSGFYKTVEKPIESIVIRNPVNPDPGDAALYRTFFNNPNEATLWGIEVEARKSLDFFGFLGLDFLDFLKYLSLGGNYTYINAEVGRTEAELRRSEVFFGTAEGDVARFSRLEPKRRLFGQPEWIANADISFDHPDWGTRITLAFFAISDVLDAAGSASIASNGEVAAFTLDRYVDSFHQLDLILSQTFGVLWGDLTFKVSIKNLTDSTRRILYDPEQTTSPVAERSYTIGRDYSFSLAYTFTF